MEILLGLGLATLLIIGWGFGSSVVALFLTLGDLLGMTFIGLFHNPTPTLQMIAVVSVVIIWLPVAIKLCRVSPRTVPIPPAREPLTLIIRTPDGEIDLDATAGRTRR